MFLLIKGNEKHKLYPNGESSSTNSDSQETSSHLDDQVQISQDQRPSR